MAYANKGDYLMPNRDTTGPMGTNMKMGRHMGSCNVDSATNEMRGMRRCGQGRGNNQGMAQGFCKRENFQNMSETEILKHKKTILEERLSFINAQLNSAE